MRGQQISYDQPFMIYEIQVFSAFSNYFQLKKAILAISVGPIGIYDMKHNRNMVFPLQPISYDQPFMRQEIQDFSAFFNHFQLKKAIFAISVGPISIYEMKHNKNMGFPLKMMGQPIPYDQPFMRYEIQGFSAIFSHFQLKKDILAISVGPIGIYDMKLNRNLRFPLKMSG